VAEVTLGQERRRNRLRHHRESTGCDSGEAGIQPARTSATGCQGCTDSQLQDQVGLAMFFFAEPDTKIAAAE